MNILGLLTKVVLPALVIFLLIGSIASTLLGLALVFRTEKALAFMRSMNRWISTRRGLREAEMPRTVGIRSRRGKMLLALFLLVGGAFALYALLLRLEIPRATVAMGVSLQKYFVLGVLLETLRWFLAAGSVVAIAVGAMILFFPSRLAALEERLNKWYSTRRILPLSGESMRYPLDMMVEGAPRASGWIIAVASLVVAAAMAMLVAARIVG